MTADKIKIGERAIIHEILPSELTLNIMEMGFLPGKQISLLQRAPLQDPLAFRLENYRYCPPESRGQTHRSDPRKLIAVCQK